MVSNTYVLYSSTHLKNIHKGVIRYINIQNNLLKGYFPVLSKLHVISFAIILFITILICFIAIIITH